MPKLYIIGDSYTAAPIDHNSRVWFNQVADRLGLEIENPSRPGVSLDWCWQQLQAWFYNGVITSEDRLVVVMTHPSRYWFLENMPDLSNPWIVDLNNWCSQEQARAIELYIKHIQRPSLDMIQMVNRLGWLAYHSQQVGIRPLMIKAFEQELGPGLDYPELNWAQGSLMTDLQYWEFENPVEEKFNEYFFGMDCRYNHLCLSNHDIMADKVTDALKGEVLDLTQGFQRALLKERGLYDDDFCHRELCWDSVVKNREFRIKNRWTVPWAIKKKLHN
jgi:hypothetical protein